MYTQVLTLSLFLHFYFIFTNAQTFLPQIILGQVTSSKAVCILYLTKRVGGKGGFLGNILVVGLRWDFFLNFSLPGSPGVLASSCTSSFHVV